MTKLSISDLDPYVKFVDNVCHGNLRDSKLAEKYLPMELHYETTVDQSLDPFGEEYFQSQIDLYEEIAGKKLDQWSGELHPVNIPALLSSPNPLGIDNVGLISEYVRALSSMLSLSRLGSAANVLDMGAGHGLSSEVYAFCGCTVHAIDIDPELTELATRRAARGSLRIKRSIMNFDSLSSIENGAYQAAFFFQSLHHCLRPWELIAELMKKLSPDGVIAFNGEPIQELWWKDWGIRLDQESLYVARKFGWFESGWSRKFITECFKRNGLKLVMFDKGLNGGLMGVTSQSPEKLTQIVDNAISLGFTPLFEDDIESLAQNYYSQIGKLSRNAFGSTFLANDNHGGGYLCYGPYVSLPPGRYRVSFLLRFISAASQNADSAIPVLVDVISGDNQESHYAELFTPNHGDVLRLVNIKLELQHNTRSVEARVRVSDGNQIWEMSLPVFEQLAPSN